MEEQKKEHEHVSHEHHKKGITEKIRENPWIIATFVLGALTLAALALSMFGGFTGNAISENAAGNKVVGFLNKYLTADNGIVLESVEDTKDIGLYTVNVAYKDSTIPVYLSYDGKYLDWGAGMTNLAAYISYVESESESSTTQKNVPKTEKPSVELYVFTYCPYGLQMEKAILPVVQLLGDKITFKIRQIGAMHGEYEKIEAERQLCIEKNYPSKFLDYIKAFAEDTAIGNCKGDAVCLAPKLDALYTKLGMDELKINSCITSIGKGLYDSEVANAESKGISGSPTLVINGVQVQASRSAEAIKGLICNAFSEVPSLCSTTLSTSQASAGFGTGTSSGSTTASC